MAYEIIKNAPMPVSAVAIKYPFPEMEVGDAFDITIAAERNKFGQHAEQASASRTGAYWGKKLGRKFATRKISDNTIRVWRTA